MTKVLVDACGWVAVVEAGINIDVASTTVVGSFEPVVLQSVWRELEMVQSKRSTPLLLEILDAKAEFMEGATESRHTDDQLVIAASEMKWPVLTVDKRLKQRLIEMGCAFIEVMSGNNLRLVSV